MARTLIRIGATFLCLLGSGLAAAAQDGTSLCDAASGHCVLASAGLGETPYGVQAAAAADVAPAAPAGGARLDLQLRNYVDTQQFEDVSGRHAWIQSVQAHFDSAYTPGPLQVGVGLSPFFAVKLDSSSQAGNMGLGRDGQAQAFLGGYTLNLRGAGTVLKYGLQRVSNPILESKDTRALPPTFRGASVQNTSGALLLEAGRFDAVLAAGTTAPQPLSSSSGGIQFDRLTYVGGRWETGAGGKLSVYWNRAHDVWDQAYLAFDGEIGQTALARWKGNVSFYQTRQQGAARQGDIDNKAYSLTLDATRAASTILLAYQRVLGPQYFDYVANTWGDNLANAAAEDYNAPQEKSLQLRYRLNGARAGVPGLSVDAWLIHGWGTDGASSAERDADARHPLYPLYWKGGVPVAGSHHELGMFLSYVMQGDFLRRGKFSLFCLRHKSSARYVSDSWHELRLTLDYPLNLL